MSYVIDSLYGVNKGETFSKSKEEGYICKETLFEKDKVSKDIKTVSKQVDD